MFLLISSVFPAFFVYFFVYIVYKVFSKHTSCIHHFLSSFLLFDLPAEEHPLKEGNGLALSGLLLVGRL